MLTAVAGIRCDQLPLLLCAAGLEMSAETVIVCLLPVPA